MKHLKVYLKIVITKDYIKLSDLRVGVTILFKKVASYSLKK